MVARPWVLMLYLVLIPGIILYIVLTCRMLDMAQVLIPGIIPGPGPYQVLYLVLYLRLHSFHIIIMDTSTSVLDRHTH